MDRRQPINDVQHTSGPVMDHRGVIRKYKLPIGNAESLLALTDTYRFFTIAPLYLYGMFLDAFLADYMQEMQAEIKLYFYKFQQPIFSGLERGRDRDWNHVLWAVAAEYDESLADFLCSISVANRANQSMTRYGLQSLSVLDPLALERAKLYRSDLPRLDVWAFGVYGNQCQGAFQAGENPLTDVPRFTALAPTEDMQVFAAAYFEGRNPIKARESFLYKHLTDES